MVLSTWAISAPRSMRSTANQREHCNSPSGCSIQGVNTNQWRGTLGVDALPSGAAAEGWCGQAPSRLLLLGTVNLPVIADPG